jgi:hypothetical protein
MGPESKRTRVIKHGLNNNHDLVTKKIKELKDFCTEKDHAVSWTFTMKAVDYRIIAKHLVDHFTEIRIHVKKKEELPAFYRQDPYKGKWVVLTISKS